MANRKFFPAFLSGLGGVTVGVLLTLLVFHSGFFVKGATPQKTSDSELQPFSGVIRTVSAEVLPVVVELDVVETEKEADAGGIPWEHFFNGGDGRRRASLGSGVIVRQVKNHYYIITNEHVIQSAKDIEVVLFDGRKYPAELVGKDKRKDIALVRVTTEDLLPVAHLGDSDDLYVGDWVLAMGSPLGFKSSVTAGIVSALGRRNGPDGNINDFIQTDAAINQGNSGGALVNLNGEIIGINTWISTYNGGNVGLGFSIPINNVKKSIDQFINEGTPRYGWLGVTISDLTPDLSRDLGYEDKKGVFILQVFKDSPADKAGLRSGDLILEVNDKEPGDSAALTYMIGDFEPGRRVSFVIWRFGRRKTAEAVIADRGGEENLRQGALRIWPGLIPAPLTVEVKKILKIPMDQTGILVETVYPKTPFQLAGLASGDIILSINGNKLVTLADFYKVINSGRTNEFVVEFVRDGKKMQTEKILR